MANAFSREERIMFDNMLEGFEDQLVIGKAAKKYQPFDAQSMQSFGDKIWIP